MARQMFGWLDEQVPGLHVDLGALSKVQVDGSMDGEREG